jgi:hypothetical protein
MWFATGLTAAAVVLAAVLQFRAESLGAGASGPGPRALDRIIPPGSCVLTDQVSTTILANRFYSDVPGCPQMVNAVGTDLALSHGKKPSDGAARDISLSPEARHPCRGAVLGRAAKAEGN